MRHPFMLLTLVFSGTLTPGALGGNSITFSPQVLSFPATGVGYSSPYSNVYVSLYPVGQPVLNGFSFSGPAAADFAITFNQCPTSPNPLTSFCTIGLSFKPSNQGIRYAKLEVQVAGAVTRSVALVGQGLAPAKRLTLSPMDLSFGQTPLGLPSSIAPMGSISVSNSGNVPATIQKIAINGANAGDYVVTQDFCSGNPIQPSQSCFLNVEFNPSAIGSRRASISFVSDAVGSPQSLPINGLGSAGTNTLQINPVAVVFEPTGTNSTEQTQVYVQNVGTNPVTVNGLAINGPNARDFSLYYSSCGNIPLVLNPSDFCYFPILFTPGALGSRSATFELIDSAQGGPQIIALQGQGIPSKFALNASDSPVNAGPVSLGGVNYPSFVIFNEGTEVVNLSPQTEGANAGDFALNYFYCGYLQPGNSCFVGLSFAPSALGPRVATVRFTDSYSGRSQSVELIGSGIAADNALSVYPYGNFAPLAVGSQESVQVSVYNQSSSPITLGTLSTPPGGDFEIAENGCSSRSVLSAFSSCSLTVSFAPSSSGPRTSVLRVPYSGNSSTYQFPLAGRGLAVAISAGFGEGNFYVGSRPPGSSITGNVQFSNTGNQPVAISAFSLDGPNAADFAIIQNPCPQAPATLHAGQSCGIGVQFTPSAPGLRTAYLRAADTASGSPQSISLIGDGDNIQVPFLNVGSQSMQFGTSVLGSPVVQTLSLNAGNLPVSLSSVKIVGANASDFSLQNSCPQALPPNDFCQLAVTFTPSVTGLRQANLRIVDNGAGSPQLVPIAGIGSKGSVSLGFSSSPVVFLVPQAVGYASSQYLYLQNTGTADLLIKGLKVLGTNRGDFGIQTTSCPLSPAPLSPGQYCGVLMQFSPLALGARLANLTVTDNAPGGAQSVALVGIGARPTKTLSASPKQVSFGTSAVGNFNCCMVVNLTDTGSIPTTISSFQIGGTNSADFTIETNECPYNPLNPGSSCQIVLSFSPLAKGYRSATITVTSDSSNSPTAIHLSGTGQ